MVAEDVILKFKSFFTGFSKGIKNSKTGLIRFRKELGEFGGFLTESLGSYQKFNKELDGSVGGGKKAANSFRNLTHGLRGFRMEALGVMFFGQMLQKTFMSLLTPVAEAFGVFDLFQDMLTVLFLPIMIDLMPVLLKFATFFMTLSPRMQKVIGVSVIFGLVIATLISLAGAFALGLGSIILFFGPLASFFGAIGVFLIPVGVIVMGLIDIFVNWGKSTRNVVRGILTVIAGVAGVIAIIMGAPALLVAAIVIAVVTIIRVIVRYWDQISDFFSNIISSMFSVGSDMFSSMAKGIKSMASAVKDAILSLFPSWARSLIWSAGKFVISIFSRNKSGGGDSESNSTSSGGKFNDFLWRPGQNPIRINPNDTLVGFKGAAPDLGGDKGINQTNNFYGFTMGDLKRELDSRDDMLLNKLQRNLG